MSLAKLKDKEVIIESLSKKYRNVTAVDDLNLEIKQGEIFGLLGSDGAGKTTTIQMLCGILEPTSGLIFIGGHDVEKEPETIRSIIGYMSQDFSLYLDMTVEENINFMADIRCIPEDLRERQKKRLLRFSRMEPFRNRRAAALSGGMKKKLALSCALIHHPKVLILDEPTTGVDPLSRTELWKILYEFIIQGITVIISTPYMDEAERCHRVALMQNGRVIACDSPSNLKKLMKQKVCSFRASNINQACRVLREELSTSGQVFGDRIRVYLDDVDEEISGIRNDMQSNKVLIDECREVSPNMDDVFLCLLSEDEDQKDEKPWMSFKHPNLGEKSIVLTEIVKKFGDFTAVDNVSFEVNTGTVFGLLGPNGAGKTTTIKMLCGLLPPTSGVATVAGYNITTQARLVKSQIGYMSQLFSLYPDLTVEQNLNFYGSIYGISRKEKKKRKEWVIELAGLKGMEKYLTSELSGGWKQKLALGTAVMHQPPVLFLDEPTSGVDPASRIDFWDVIHRFAEEGITIIVTTHFMDEAERCNILGLMNAAKLIALGTPEELKNDINANFYEITSSSVSDTFDKLSSNDIVYQAALYGDKIHISSKEKKKLTKGYLKAEGIDVDKIISIMPSIEDVFIYHVLESNQD